MSDINLVKPYVSNLDKDVFVLRNLPEEVASVLFAYYSRSPKSLRENLAALLVEGDLDGIVGGNSPGSLGRASERARAFHEKWTVGYGHKSVAEHSRIRIAVENCSILAAKAIEDSRLGSYTEKSTRYVQFAEDSFYKTPNFPAALLKVYEEGAKALMRAYSDLSKKTAEALKKNFPAASEKQCSTKAFDLVRGLLPAGTLTNLGMTLNGTLAEYHFSKLMAHPLQEVGNLAKLMDQESRTEIPTLLKYVTPAKDYQNTLAYIRDFNRKLGPPPAQNQSRRSGVRKVNSPVNPLWTLAAAILLEAEPSLEYSEARYRTSTESTARELVDLYLKQRGSREAPGRALESLQWSFEIICDYGAWRDLQRHRMVSQNVPIVDCKLGFTIDSIMSSLGLYDQMADALKAAEKVWKQLADYNPTEAQYIVPLAYNVRYILRANLREQFHIIELRSKKEGHPSYRKIAQDIGAEILDDCPFLSPYLRIDKSHYDFARNA